MIFKHRRNIKYKLLSPDDLPIELLLNDVKVEVCNDGLKMASYSVLGGDNVVRHFKAFEEKDPLYGNIRICYCWEGPMPNRLYGYIEDDFISTLARHFKNQLKLWKDV